MTFAIQLFVDPVSDSAVRSLWEEVARIGLSKMRDSGNRPHVSLAIYRELDVSVCASLLTSFATTHAPFALTFESLGIFHAEKTVVFLAPIVSSHLLDVHREVHAVAAGYWCIPYALLPPWALDSSLCTCDTGTPSSPLSSDRHWSRSIFSSHFLHRRDWSD